MLIKEMLSKEEKGLNRNSIVFGHPESWAKAFIKYNLLHHLNDGEQVIVFDFNHTFSKFAHLLDGFVHEVNENTFVNPFVFHRYRYDKKQDTITYFTEIIKLFETLSFTKEKDRKKIYHSLEQLYRSFGIFQGSEKIPNTYPSIQDISKCLSLTTEQEQMLIKLFPKEKSDVCIDRGWLPLHVINFSNIKNELEKKVLFQVYLRYMTLEIYTTTDKNRVFVLDDVAPFLCDEKIEGGIFNLFHLHRYTQRNKIQLFLSSYKTQEEYLSRILPTIDSFAHFPLYDLKEEHFVSKTFGYEEHLMMMNSENHKAAYFHIGDFSGLKRLYYEIYLLNHIEEYLKKRKEVMNLGSLSGEVKKTDLKFKNVFKKEFAYTIDGYDIELILTHCHLEDTKLELKW